MKKILLCITIIMSIFMCGCYNYKDINKVIFVTTVVFDIDAEGKIVLYVEAMKPYRGAGKGSEEAQRLIFKSKGKTIFEALRNINLDTSYKLNYTQNKALIYTERAAKVGLKNFSDLPVRDQEFLIRPYIAIFNGDPEKLLKTKYQDSEFIGFTMMNIIENIEASSRAVDLTFNEYLNEREKSSRTSVMTEVSFGKDQLDTVIEANGGAIIKDDKMVDTLKKAESEGYNLLIDNVRTGTLEIPDKKFVTLEVLKSKTKTDVNYDGKKIHIKKYIKINAEIASSDESFITSDENIEKIKKKAEANIKYFCSNVFYKYKDKNLDIFYIESEMEDKYPHVDIKDPISISDIEIIPEVNIEGSGKVNNAF